MTRQEVLENIRYNENLVNQYVGTLNNLQSRVSNVNAEINQYNSQLTSLNAQVRKVSGQISELNQLKIKCQKLQEDFAGRQASRINKFNVNVSSMEGTGFISSYISGMSSLLSGSEYKNAYNGIGTAISTIKSDIREKQGRLNELRNSIAMLERSIENARRNLCDYQNQISETNTNLSYRRQRITYWRNQLNYAT